MHEDSEARVAEFLRELGLEVEKIAEQRDPTPDFVVRGDALEYFVEVKAKGPSTDWLDALGEVGTASAEVAHGTTGPISRIFGTAEKQLGFEPSRRRLRILAFDVDPRFPEVAEQIEAAAYGSRLAVGFDGGAERVLYVDTPQFARYGGIDLVLVFLNDGVRALINDHSGRAPDARASRICRELGGAVYDPAAALADGDALALPEEWRSLPIAEKEQRFRARYRRMLIQFTTYSATARVEQRSEHAVASVGEDLQRRGQNDE